MVKTRQDQKSTKQTPNAVFLGVTSWAHDENS